MLKLVLTLAFAVMFCECSIIKRDNSCYQLEWCILPIGLLEYHYRDGVYETFCQAEAVYRQCVADFKPQCHDDATIRGSESLADAGEYICSSEGSAVIHAAASSDCVTNVTKKFELERSVQNCVTESEQRWRSDFTDALTKGEQLSEANLCVYFEQGLNCVTDLVNDNCGAMYGSFIRNLIQRVIRARFSCGFLTRHGRSLLREHFSSLIGPNW